MNKKTRIKIYNKYGGHCAYCGKEIAYKDMQVDHIIPLYRGWDKRRLDGLKRGDDNISNYNPSCRSCNFRKSTMSIEDFREELRLQARRIVERSFQVRQSLDYGLLSYDDKPIEFYFEKYDADNHRSGTK
ncbi:MAG: HNH endonuclease [Prevotella sp.]|jgi:5-methylcytosine-specific restriction endonuclease McrA|nr:HNH endonuclease signature motif containing protein [Prevotella sp.]MCH3994876.1 HNH endonuclease [Prevotella sp.]